MRDCSLANPQPRTNLRLILAILVSASHPILVLAASPYKMASTSFTAVATSFTLLCTLFMALLIRNADALTAALDVSGLPSARRPGDEVSIFALTVVILVINGGVVAVACALLLYQVHSERRQPTLRVQASGQPPSLVLPDGKRWHLFLSHNWGNQDVAATLKRQLQLLLPGVCVFLDVSSRAPRGTACVHK